MLNASEISSWVKPFGFTLSVKEVLPPRAKNEDLGPTDRVYFDVVAEGLRRGKIADQCRFSFSIPQVDEDGTYMVDDQVKMVVREGVVDPSSFRPGEAIGHTFLTRNDVVLRGLNQSLTLALRDWYSQGQPPSQAHLQQLVDRWFKISPMTHPVPESRVGVEDLKSLIYIHAPDEGLDLAQRQFRDNLWRRVDPASTPGSKRVNVSYRLVDGAYVAGGEIVPGRSPFCTTIDRYHIAACLTPRRTHLARSAYCNSMDLEEPEYPKIGHAGLPGRHLLTAIMNIPAFTGEDAIVVSQTAASKMTGIRTMKERLFLFGNYKMSIKVGDEIAPDDEILTTIEPEKRVDWELTLERAEREGNKKYAEKLKEKGAPVTTKYARRIKHPGTITDIKFTPTVYMGVPAVRLTVTVESRLPLRTGDKIFTRSALKGVVRVLPDYQMPMLKTGRVIDMCISPESVINRRAMSVYWEMMANQYAARGGTVDANNLAPKPSFRELVQEGYGKKRELFVAEKSIGEVFVGFVFTIRILKISKEIASAHDGKIRLTGMRTTINSAKFSGQRRDLAKAQAMLGRGLVENFKELTKRNMRGQYALRELTKTLGCERSQTQ